jgi:hypothetical protein
MSMYVMLFVLCVVYENGNSLAPSDYHRWHTPMRCRMDQRASLDGTYYSVSPHAVRRVNVFGKNKRELCLLHRYVYCYTLTRPYTLLTLRVALHSHSHLIHNP